MGIRKILTAVIVALVLASLAVVAAPPGQQRATQPTAVTAPGTIRLPRCVTYWADERVISSKIPGRIDRRFVNDGDVVDKDQELARLDDREAKLEFSMQNILGTSELDELVQYEQWLEYRARLDAATRLVTPGAISKEEYRLAQVQEKINHLRTQKEAEKRQVEQLKAERAKVILDDHVITSPMRGIIKKCVKREKESVTPNDSQGLFQIVAIDRLWVEGNAPVSELYRIKLGQRVEVRLAITQPEPSPLDFFEPGKTRAPMPPTSPETAQTREPRAELPQEKIVFPGRIVYIDPGVLHGSRTFTVRAEVDNQYDEQTGDPIMRAGLDASMTIYLNQR